MPRPPNPKYANNPLRLLRGLLSPNGELHPVTQIRLSEMIGIPLPTIRSVESGQRPFSPMVRARVASGTGALWDERRGVWTYCQGEEEENPTFDQKSYKEWSRNVKRTCKDREQTIRVMSSRLDKLFSETFPNRRRNLLLRLHAFLNECEAQHLNHVA